MNNTPQKFNIDSLDDEECRDILLKIQEIVSDFPDFCVTLTSDSGYFYSCCGEMIQNPHSDECGIGKLRSFFLL